MLKFFLKHFFLLISFVWITSCAVQTVDSSKYIKYLSNPQNGLEQSVRSNEYQFSLRFLPADLLALREQESRGFSQKTFEDTKKNFDDLIYFSLSIVDTERGMDLVKKFSTDSLRSAKATQYFSFDMAQHIYLVQGGDTIGCTLFNYDRNYGVSPENNFSLAFKHKKNSDSDLQIIYEDRVLNCGIIRFSIKQQDIIKIPSVKI